VITDEEGEHAVRIARSAGSLTLLRDVFSRVPGTGRWMIVLLADGSIGIGGDPTALLHRVAELLAPLGQALVEVQPPGRELRRERVRLRLSHRHGQQAGEWFPWAHVGADQLAGIAAEAGLSPAESWSSGGRWFATLRKACGSEQLRPARQCVQHFKARLSKALDFDLKSLRSSGMSRSAGMG